ncbi:ABC transporter ATP-binding protein [Candidatus Bathyarchaeota archaeon]|nr:ABC transporter ATP-binding protein [Candidatus Bathyarchaeota archaeon]
MPDTLLDVRNLIAYYMTPTAPVRAVDNVSFNVTEKEILGIAGESGCGKSTLAYSILRLLKPPGYIRGGEVLFKGSDLLKIEEEELRRIRWKHISYIPQSSMNALNPVMRIEEQIGDAIINHEKISKGELRKRIEDLLVSVGLSPSVAHMYPHELSGGMRQRVVIAMAMALDPELIIADEPTTALDVVVQRGILQLLRDIRSKLKASVIMITHDMAAQAQIVDRLAIMYAGKIVEIGDANDLFNDPLHPYSRALISAIPSISEKKKLKGVPGFPPDLRSPPPGCRFYPRCPHRIPGKCNVDEPRLIEVKNDRLVACHLYR